MLKIYLTSCIIYYAIFMIEGLIFRKRFIINTNILYKKFISKEEHKREPVLKTIIRYLLISLIPIYRTIVLLTKLTITFNVEMVYNTFKKIEEEKLKEINKNGGNKNV